HRHFFPRPVDHLFFANLAAVAVLDNQNRHDHFTATAVRHADDTGLLNRRMVIHEIFHFRWPDFVAGHVDHALEPVLHEEVAILIDTGQVTGTKKAAPIAFKKGLTIGLVVMPI